MEQLPFPPSLSDVAAWEALDDEQRDAALRGRGIADGLPLARVTTGAVEAALAAAGLAADEVVASVPPLSRPAAAGSVAICALLAGCEPAQLPVVVASVRGVADPRFNGLGVFTTTGSAAVATIVGGPVAAAFNGGANLLGPGSRPNASAGRALALAVRVIGGAVPGLTDMATMGQPGKYTFCFAENAEESPWEPIHASLGLDAAASAVTLFAAAGTVEVTNAHAATAEEVVETLAAALYQPGSLDPGRRLIGGGRHLVLLSPEWAAILSAAGLSRDAVRRELHARAAWPLSVLPPALRRLVRAEWTAGHGDGRVRATASADDLLLAVAGGAGIKQTLVPGWAGGSAPVTVPVAAGPVD
jgi:hypothetical protein